MADRWYSVARLALMLFFLGLMWRTDHKQRAEIRSLRQQLSQEHGQVSKPLGGKQAITVTADVPFHCVEITTGTKK